MIKARHCNTRMTTVCSEIIPSSGSDTFLASVSLSDDTFILRTGFRLLLPAFPRLDFAVHYKSIEALHFQPQRITC